MSELPARKDKQQEKKEVIKAGGKSLLLTSRESPDSVMLYIGGNRLFCVAGQVKKPGSLFERLGDDLTIANLPHLYFNAECSLQNNFQRGADTNMILRLLMSIISDRYPTIRGMRFEDASNRVCDNRMNVNLSEISYITSGQTWYQKHFGAQPRDLDAFAAAHTAFSSLKATFSWEKMDVYIQSPVPDWMGPLFVVTATWQEFFSAVRDRMGAAEFCEFCAPWLHEFLLEYFPFQLVNSVWVIPIQKTVEYTVTTSGGRYRSTRKRYVHRRPRNLP